MEPNIQELVRLWAEHVDQQLRVDVSKLRNALQISMAPVSSGASVIVNPTDQSDEAYLKFLLRQIVVICLHVRKLKQQPALLCSAQKKLSDTQKNELDDLLTVVHVWPTEVEEGSEGSDAATLSRSLTEIFAGPKPIQRMTILKMTTHTKMKKNMRKRKRKIKRSLQESSLQESTSQQSQQQKAARAAAEKPSS